MYLLYADETTNKYSKFYVYGGIAVHGEYAASLSAAVKRARERNNYVAGDQLKFATGKRDRPSQVTEE